MFKIANENDADKIVEIFSETKTPWSKESVLSSIIKDFVLMYEDKGVIVSSKVIDECEILNFAVEKENRGKGIGEKLIREFLNSEFTRGCRIFLDVRKSNLPAIALYEKIGFKRITERKNFYQNPSEDAIIMEF